MVTNISEKYKKIVWGKIEKYLKDPIYPAQFKIPAKYKPDLANYWQAVKEYPLRKGKYLRPTLVCLTAEAMGQPLAKAIKTAAAMQVSEDWLLIHDDIQDHSELRRGKPTLHKIYGEELALNAGDSLHMIMWKILLDNRKILGLEKTMEVADEFYKILLRTSHGQGIEIAWARENKLKINDNDWYFIADGKTAYYSLAGPLRLGGIIANASKKQLNSLTEFGLNLGRCFQLVDDILDLTAQYKGKGQKIGSDIYEGKRTLILGHLLRTAKADDKEKIIKILGKKREEKTEEEVRWIIKKMHDYGSLDYAGKIAKNYRDEAKKIFNSKLDFLKSQPTRKNLEEIIDFILERKY